MKKHTIALALIPVLALTLFTASPAAAHGLNHWFGGFGMMGIKAPTPDELATTHQTMFQQQSQILGLSVDEIKNAWAEGKTMQQLAKEKGITQEQINTRMQELLTAELKTQLQTLVDKGIITQAQADKRLQVMQTQLSKKPQKMNKKLFRHGWWF